MRQMMPRALAGKGCLRGENAPAEDKKRRSETQEKGMA